MSIISSFFTVPCYINLFKECNSKLQTYSQWNSFTHCTIPSEFPFITKKIIKKKPPTMLKCTARDSSFDEENTASFDWGDEEQGEIEEDMGSPWEGAIIYKRNPSISHVEYCTTLERLGLVKLSTEVSKSRASVMGLRVTKSVKDFPFGTPVQISIDVTRKKHKLRLDGIIKTVITLACQRCGDPAAECIFSNLSLLLTEEPIKEEEIINMGVIFGEDKFSGEEDDEASIDMDDWLHFPPGEKEIDISKNIRDLIHLEITMSALCDINCKGLCLKCGVNLNTSICKCSKVDVTEKGNNGPLRNLKKQMQQK